MEIPEKGPWPPLHAQNRLIEGAARPPIQTTGGQGKAAEKDSVSLTESGRVFQAAAEHAHLLPDIREDRVRQLKRQLEEGTYRVKGHRVAVNMINETLENNRVLEHIDNQA